MTSLSRRLYRSVDLDPKDTAVLSGALALVRSGAVYLDPATGNISFHPSAEDPNGR